MSVAQSPKTSEPVEDLLISFREKEEGYCLESFIIIGGIISQELKTASVIIVQMW